VDAFTDNDLYSFGALAQNDEVQDLPSLGDAHVDFLGFHTVPLEWRSSLCGAELHVRQPNEIGTPFTDPFS
jgi:hypothetical protein